jgi:hypothetical protein
MLVRITISGTYTELGVQAQNVIHAINHEGQMSLAQIAADIRQFWIPAFRPSCSNVWRWDFINVRNLDDPTQISFQDVIVPAITGQTSFNTHSPVLTPILTLQTDRIGPTGRGRIYIPGLGTNMINRTRITQTFANNFAAIAAIIQRYLAGGAGNPGFTFCIAGKNRQANGTPLVSAYTLRAICGTQRRRNELTGI